MKRRILAMVLSLCLLLPVCAGAAQEPDRAMMNPAPKTATRGWFLEQLASASGEDVTGSSWIDMEDYFADGTQASDGIKWAFAKWILNLSLIQISEPTRLDVISYDVFCL